MSGSIDPKDAATVTSVIEDDHFSGPGEAGRRTVVVRLLKQRPLLAADVPHGARVRPLPVLGGDWKRSRWVRVHVVFASTYTRYEASRITADLRRKFESRQTVRLTTIRALMHSVRLPEVKETVEYEEAMWRAETA